MKKLVAAAMFVLFGALFACVSRADAVPPTTNNWFDVSFEALTPETAISVDSTTGISLGAGSWTSVPTTGSATIAADADAGGEATLLSLSAPGEELTFTPAPFATTSGYETVSVEIKADAIDELPEVGNDVQGAFTVYLDENDELSAQGWTAAGWTNLVYAAVGSLTNAWFTLYLDFAKEGGVRKVRYSVKPATGALTVLADAGGTTWFQAGKNADVVSSVSFSGTGSVRAFSGDELEVLGVAIYNGVAYETFEEAIAAGVADSWANGNVVLLADATWTPTATGAYQIDVDGHELTINGVNGTWSGTTYTVPATHWYWIGGASSEWANGANWSHFAGGAAANAYPNEYGDAAHFPSGAGLTLNSYVTVGKIFTDGTLTLSGNGSGGVRTASSNNSAPLIIGGEGLLRLAGVNINVPYATKAANAQTQISNAVEIVEGTTNTFTLCVGNDRNASLYFRGAMSGSGRLVVRSNTDSGSYQAYFHGDASQFSGSIADHRDGDTYAARIQFMASNTVSGLATYDLAATYSSGGQNYVLRGGGGSDVTYQMGAINGEVHFDGNNNTKTTQYYGYTLEIGGKNEDCSFGGTIARSGYASYTKKVGTADLTFTGSQIPYLDIANGTYIIGAASALPGTDMTFSGGAFSVAEGVSVDPVSKFAEDSTAAVVFDDRGLVNTWAGGLTDARVPFGFTKKGAGTLTLTTVPTHTTKTTIEDGVLVVPQGTTIAQLSCEGGKLAVPLAGTEDETTVLNITALAEGTDYDALTNAVAIPGATVAVESDGGSGYIVKATRTAQTFMWTGAVDNDWVKGGNWTVGGVTATTAPLAIDNVLFPQSNAENFEAWDVSLSADVVVATITNEEDVVYSGAHLITAVVIGGTGKTVLGDGTGFLEKSGGMTVDTPVQVTASSESPASVRTAREERIRINGDLTGNGTLKIGKGDTSSDERVVCELNGDNRAFAGTILVQNDKNTRNNTKLMSANASSSNTSWTVYNSSNAQFLPFSGQTVYFGALNGAIYQASMYYNNVFEIGALNEDCSFGGKLGATSQNHITKVGSATLTFSGSDMGNLVVKDGVFAALNEGSFPKTSITFAGEGGFFDPVTNTVDFAAKLVNSTTAPIGLLITNDLTIGEIPASNTAGLTKKGAGTLTLSAAPLYTGTTRVEDGKLVVDGALSGTSAIVVDDPAAAMEAGTWYIAAESMRRPTLVSAAPDAEKYKFVRSTTIIGDKTYTCFKVGEALPPLVLILQ